jgi:surface antigen
MSDESDRPGAWPDPGPATGPGRGDRPGPGRPRPGLPQPTAGWRLGAALALVAAMPLLGGGSLSSAHLPRVSARICDGYASCGARGDTSYGYWRHSATSYWRMTPGNECTNYVAYVESTVYGARTPRYLLGNGGQWAAAARAHGVRVNHTPAVGAVAEWNGGAFGMGGLGHVAVVEQVGPRDRHIVISQQHMSSDTNDYDWTRINAGYPADQWQEWPTSFIHFPLARSTAVGYFNPAADAFALRDALFPGPANYAFRRAARDPIPLAGNWAGRSDEVGYYSPATGLFSLSTSLGAGPARYKFTFGPPGMIPLAGNWDGRGRRRRRLLRSGDGLFQPAQLAVRGPASYSFSFGPPGMIPLAGNWDGRGGDGIGYYNPRTGWFHLRNSLRAGPASYSFKFGPPGMIPLAGDWTGDGRDGVGFYNRGDGWFHLRNSLRGGPASYSFKFGPPGMIPLAGDWTGDGRDGVGFYNRGDGWFHLRDSPHAGPANFSFRSGPKHMIPLAGNWDGQ